MELVRSVPLPGTQEDPRYPDSDGRPMGDTDFHYRALYRLRALLEGYFADAPDVYIASNLVMYYKEGDPKSRRDPDTLIARGVVGKHARRSFRVWEEGVVPCVLFEVASRRTWRVDLGVKPAEYANIGVKEYFLFDPEGSYLDPVLQGFRTVKGKPVPMKPAADGSLVSKQLGLRLVPQGEELQLFDRQTGELVLTQAERLAAQERQRADEAERRLDAMAAELARLREELERRPNP